MPILILNWLKLKSSRHIDFELAEIEIKQAIARMKVKKRHM